MEQPLRLFADYLVFQNAWILPGQRPGHKEWRPVDVVAQGFDAGFHALHAQTMGNRWRVAGPVKGQIVLTSGSQGHRRRAWFLARVLDTHGFILATRARNKIIVLCIGEQSRDHAHGARGVLNIDRRAAVVLLDFDRRMGLRRRGPANQQRNGKALAFHLFRHVNHLVQRRGNQPGEANQVGIHFAGGFEDFVRRHHHAKIDNFVVIALQHHANDIFTDVVDVAFHGRNDHLAVAGALFLAGFNIRFQIGDRLFHHAGRLYHLRQEHFAFAEQIADHVHAVHQRAFYHFYRTSGLLARLFGIQLDKLGNAFYQRVFKPFFHVPATPFRLLGVGGVVRFATAVFFRQLQQTLGAVSMTVKDHVFDGIAQLSRQIVINRQLTGVNDPHIHAVTDGVVEEDGVNRFANRIVAAEREGDV